MESLLTQRALVDIAYVKNGPGHNDLTRHEVYVEPGGLWQYQGPIALLVNEVTGSAADLFACELRSAGRVVTVGTTERREISPVPGSTAVLRAVLS